jgi:hypothetical protein
VTCLATRLRELAGSEGVVVFSKSEKENRRAFGLNEMLYDICVCEVATCDAYRAKRKLSYIKRALWLVESEFARNSAEAVKDFNKLVIGRAANKLFVAPRLAAPANEQRYLAVLLPVALSAAGDAGENVYVAFVPHPSRWEGGSMDVALWRLLGDGWHAVVGGTSLQGELKSW